MTNSEAPQPNNAVGQENKQNAELSSQQQFATNQGVDGSLARLLGWLGNHFFAVTLVLTGALLAWAIGVNGR